ncbi:MAG TPA: hypothetical protein PKL54_12365, partial [Candidatus Hydrogenedentes bacterium]|nr:hypothetical protein [Candidatus Hydrogenedentota bacterium]
MGVWRREGLTALGVAALLVLGAAAVYPGIFLRGDIAGPADLMYTVQPWARYAPEDWPGNSN